MPVYSVTVTDDEGLALQARVVWLQEQSEMIPPPFPPVTPVADVEALLASFLVSPIEATVTWYVAQST